MSDSAPFFHYLIPWHGAFSSTARNSSPLPLYLKNVYDRSVSKVVLYDVLAHRSTTAQPVKQRVSGVLRPPGVSGGACRRTERAEWNAEYDNQVYTSNYSEHITVTEVSIKCYGVGKENEKNPVLNIGRHYQRR